MTTAVAPQQANGAPSPFRALKTLLDQSKGQIAMALPRHLTPDRMIRVALTAYQTTPELHDCDLVSIVGCVVQASQLGLDIGGVLGQCYMIPFRNTKKNRRDAQLIIGYKGYLVLARRSGEVSHFSAQVVYANDHFEFEYGTEARLIHKPHLTNRGDPIACYAVIRLKDGSHDFEVWGWSKVLEWQARYGKKGQSGGYGPWYDHLEEMARKSLIRALAKRAPVSVEIQQAAAIDERREAGETLDYAEVTGLSSSDALAARLESAIPEPHQEEIQGTAAKIPSVVDDVVALFNQLGIGPDDQRDWLETTGCKSLDTATPEELAVLLASLKKQAAKTAK